MTRYVFRPLTDSSWMLSVNGERMGIASKTKDGRISMIGKTAAGVYASFDEIGKASGATIIMESPPEQVHEKEAGLVDGFPVKHDTWHNVETDPIPSYTRTTKSNNRFAAGYYALHFANGWTQSFCPRLSTLSEHEFVGPFKTKLEMQHNISIKSKAIDV